MAAMTGLITKGLSSPAWFAALEAAPSKSKLAFGNLPDGTPGRQVATPSCPNGRDAPSNAAARRLYWACRRRPTMAINATRNRRSGPGGSSRRLHQIPLMGPIWGRIRLDARNKGVGFRPAWYRRYRAKLTSANDNRMALAA